MEFEDIVEVNGLFERLYPYIARQILDVYGRKTGSALEIGPYAPGISIALAELCPNIDITLGDDFPGMVEYLREEIKKASLEDRIQVREMDKFNLPFADGSVDLAYFRGALFFWENEKQILKEMYRVIKSGGVAVAGGGFGAETPDEVIDEVLSRSHELNRRLSKRVLAISELEATIHEAGLAENAELERRHGLWVILRKTN